MNLALRIFAALCGVVLLLPGLCTVVFGGMFALGGFSGGDIYGFASLSIPLLVIGGLLVWGGIAVLLAVFKRR